MSLIFGNPAGWWVLLGVPVLVVIHWLQRKSRRLAVSTLFLIEKQELESRSGRRFERWRNSRLFWLQVLAVVLLAWLFSEPRWMEASTVQRVALVVDSSLSMAAFRKEVENGLAEDTEKLARGATRTQWWLLESDPARPPLYRGEDRLTMLAALRQWQPDLGQHDPLPELRAARSMMGDKGLEFFVTDQVPADGALPVETQALAYGHPLENVGIAAAAAETREGQALWRVMVRNYGAAPQQRSWWLEAQGQRTPEQTVRLAAGEAMALQGIFPPGQDHITFTLQGDAFGLDDRAPLVLPLAKPLALDVLGPAEFKQGLEAILPMIESSQPSGTNEVADILFDGGKEWFPVAAINRVFFAELGNDTVALTRAQAAAETSPLMEGLNFSGLLYQAPPPITPLETDVPLLWDGAKALIALRGTPGGGQTLIFNVDPRHSNLARLPAFALLINRFAEEARRRKPAPERDNFLAGEPLRLVLPPQTQNTTFEISAASDGAQANPAEKSGPHAAPLTPSAASQALAPSPPAFFTVRVDGQPWLDAASEFPDPRESDFRESATVKLDRLAQTQREEAHSRPDALAPLWLLALLGVLLFSWKESGKS